jgi:hypothetical protein
MSSPDRPHQPLLREFVISQLERVEGFLIVGDGLAALRVVVPLLTCLHEDEGMYERTALAEEHGHHLVMQ